MQNYDALIGRAASTLTKRRGDDASASGDQDGSFDGLLFMGNPHETVPRGLLLDERLGAVDVLGWQVIRLSSNADRTTAFPTYDDLEPLLRSGANRKASRKTVARVIAILRLTRWMTLGMKARNAENGRVIGNVYVLHDEPLAPAESLSLDAEYIEYVIKCTRHSNTNVAEVALLVCGELETYGVLDAPTRLDILDQRSKRQKKAEFPKETKSKKQSFQGKLSEFPNEEHPSFQGKLSHESKTYSTVSDSAHPTVRSYTNSVCKGISTARDADSLVWSWPLELTADERESIKFQLSGLTTEMQQAVIDEAAGRVEQGKVKNVKGFLNTLARRAATNKFHLTNYGLSIAKKRSSDAVEPQNTTAAQTPVVPIKPRERKPENEPQPITEVTEQARDGLFKRLGIKR